MSGMSNNIKEIVENKDLSKKDIIIIEDPIELNNILSEIIVKMGDLIHNGVTQEFSIINEGWSSYILKSILIQMHN